MKGKLFVLSAVVCAFLIPPTVYGQTDGVLTTRGIFNATNNERVRRGVVKLVRDSKLDAIAQARLDDMFARQYFDHVGPAGEDVQSVTEAQGYSYLRIGENLAFGVYEDDRDVVNAWMQSEGHRENILDTKYTNIGVAVDERLFDGEESWIAVQVFARPESLCEQPDTYLKTRIRFGTLLIQQGEALLNAIADYVQHNPPSTQVFSLIDAHGQLAQKLVVVSRDMERDVTQYNRQVDVYNHCIR